MKTLVTPEKLAKRYGTTVKTLANWRWKKFGPKPTKIGSATFYAESDIEAFEESARKNSAKGRVSPGRKSTLAAGRRTVGRVSKPASRSTRKAGAR